MNRFLSNLTNEIEIKFGKQQKDESLEVLTWNLNAIKNNFLNRKSYLLSGDVQSGKTNNILNLVAELHESNEIDLVVYFSGRQNDLLLQNQLREFKTFKSCYPETIILKNETLDPEFLERSIDNDFVIINSLKTKQRLDEVNKLINNMSKNKKILIIDDECDDTSLSKKSQILFSRYKSRPNIKIISISASCYRNLYLNQNFYDEYIVLKTNKNYVGIDNFLNNKSSFYTSNDTPTNMCNLGYIYWVVNTVKHKLISSQILINISLTQMVHEETLYNLKQFHNEISSSKNVLKSLLENLFKNIDNALIDRVFIFLKNMNMNSFKIINQSSQDIVTNNGYEVIVGGFSISRGITYENLIAEVMLNAPEKNINPGTLIQRARWLGYRKEKIDFMKVFVNDLIYTSFQEILKLEKITKKFNFNMSDSYKQIIDKECFEYIKIF